MFLPFVITIVSALAKSKIDRFLGHFHDHVNALKTRHVFSAENYFPSKGVYKNNNNYQVKFFLKETI